MNLPALADPPAPDTVIRRVERRSPRLPALDALRFLAASMVVFFHYVGYGGGPNGDAWGVPTVKLFPTVSWIAEYGWEGVELFFLISGFVICMSSWGRTLGEFFVSRVVRLYPAYWVAVLLTTACLAFWPTVRQSLAPSGVLTNLTMLQEPLKVNDVDAVYWSLWSELRFYLLFAIVVWRGVTYRRAVIFCAVWTIATVVDFATNNSILDMWAQPLYSCFFIAGIAMFLMYKFGQNLLLWGIIGISFLIAERGIDIKNTDHAHTMHLHLPNWPAQLVVAAAFLLVIGVALNWFAWANWRWLSTLGALTYPLYLVHEYVGWTIIHALRHYVAPYPLVLLTAVAMSVLAWCIHKLVERPFAPLLKRGLTTGLTQMRAPSATAKRLPSP